MRTRLLRHAATGLFLLLLPRTALGWSGPLHRSILEGAFRVSPAAAARVPEEHRSAVMKAVEGTETSERIADPAREAEQILRALLAKPAGRFGYNDALALGRYLHDVANAAVPADTKPQGPGPEELFSGREIAVYRDPAPRAASLSEALRASRLDCGFGADRLESLGAWYRAAVQATVDALLRLAPSRAPASDTGFDVFIIADSVDNGKSGAREVGQSERSWAERDNFGDDWIVTETTTFFDMSQAGKGTLVQKSYEVRGVHLLEWTSRTEGPVTRNRILVLNNTSSCVPTLRFQAGAVRREVRADVAPRSVGRIEFETPAATPRAGIRLYPLTSRCAPGARPKGGTPTARVFGVPATVTVSPRWDEAFLAPIPEEPRETPPRG